MIFGKIALAESASRHLDVAFKARPGSGKCKVVARRAVENDVIVDGGIIFGESFQPTAVELGTSVFDLLDINAHVVLRYANGDVLAFRYSQ